MRLIVISLLILVPILLTAQSEYEPSDAYPFGRPNPEAPKEIKDFDPLIGICDCNSQTRNPDQTWAKPNKMTWEFKYIMNGMGVQDQTLKEDGKHSGSIRQFIADSSRWFVHYYSNTSPTPVLSAWEGNKKEDKIILYREQNAPNGMNGFYKINFYDINKDGFKWLGEWVNTKETISFPTWKITCIKRKDTQKLSDEEQIKTVAKSFSTAYLKQDYEAIAQIYTKDAKIFPHNTSIISGYDAIKKRWASSSGYTPIEHQILPEEITVLGDTAHDYGYYQGKNKNDDGTETNYKGKYVVVWKKANGIWKMYLDIWNPVKE
ncbi:nuclear transport factor 2 family protein [uncultured Aquimarina sp.]|uniref:YybH family protein n=1 Tax=uncultured Aquimarina sp. TaxID=575652 RepID=UPI002620979A|nr:nuclear transport factor 2 family protein [uncultured Aquimarina sp.]